MSRNRLKTGAITYKSVLVLISGAVALAALVSIPPFLFLGRLNEAASAKNRAYEALGGAEELSSAIRAYGLTRGSDPSGRDAVVARLGRLRELTRIEAEIAPLDAITASLEARQQSSPGNERPIEPLLAALGEFVAIERQSLALSGAAFDADAKYLFLALMVDLCLFFLLTLFSIRFIYRQSQQRAKNDLHRKTELILEDQESLNVRLQEANETLRESEGRLSVTLDSIGDAVIVTDVGAFIERMNPVAERLTGWTIEEAVDRPIQDVFVILNQETRRAATVPVMSTLARGVIQGLANHTILVSRDGKEKSISDSCAPIFDHGGNVIGAILVFRDVTEAYEIEKALHESATQIRTILDTVIDGIITFNPDGGAILNVNPAIERMFGYPADELVGRNFISLIPEFEGGLTEKSLAYYSVSEEDRRRGLVREATGRRKSGDIFPLEISVGELQLGGRRFFTAIMRDVTTRKQAEEAMLKSNALQDSIFESANFSSIATDTKGVIRIFNVGARRMLGYDAAEALGNLSPIDIFDPQEIVERARAMGEEMGTTIAPGFEALVFKASRGIEDIYEPTLIRKDGSRFPALVSVTALRDPQDRIIGYLFIGTDNTARKTIERERTGLLKALQEKNDELQIARIVADKANHAKSNFLSNMSHELRTPLSAILGFAQLLESSTPPPTASQRRSIEQILKGGWYLLELINEILDLALIESGKLSLSLEPVSISEILTECELMVALQAKKRNIAMSFMGFEKQYSVRADRTRLKQIVINLLSNAIKYNRENGTIAVEYLACPPDSIKICVTDSGEGLAPEQLAHLFEPFNRLGREKNVEEGTGIGLVVSKRLIELMGGIIGAESVVGQGSTFWIEMSLIEEASVSLHPADHLEYSRYPVPDAGLKRKLLYVEDNPANLMLVEDIVARRSDLHMLSATDGYRGIEIARLALPDVILMDINLPGINGIEALRILQKDPATTHIPIIALSANAIPRDIERGMEAGFFRYLTKPIKVGEFMETLDFALKCAEATHAGA